VHCVVSFNEFQHFCNKREDGKKIFLHLARHFRSQAGIKETRTVLSGDNFKLCQASVAVKLGLIVTSDASKGQKILPASSHATMIDSSVTLRRVFKCVSYFFVIKPARCPNFTNLFWHEILHVSDSSSVRQQ